MMKRNIETLDICGRKVPIVEMDFKDLQKEYKKDTTSEVTGEYLAFYHKLETTIYISRSRDALTMCNLVFHEAMHALFHLKYDNLTDHFQLDEEAMVRLLTSCKDDVVDIYDQIYTGNQTLPYEEIYSYLVDAETIGVTPVSDGIVSVEIQYKDGLVRSFYAKQDVLKEVYRAVKQNKEKLDCKM